MIGVVSCKLFFDHLSDFWRNMISEESPSDMGFFADTLFVDLNNGFRDLNITSLTEDHHITAMKKPREI